MEGGFNKPIDRKPHKPDNKYKGEYKGSYNRKGFYLYEFLMPFFINYFWGF